MSNPYCIYFPELRSAPSIVRLRTTNWLRGTLSLTVIGEGEVPHLAPWQRATALSGLINCIDTQAILMTPSIYSSPLSFLSHLPSPSPWPCSCILPQFKYPELISVLTCVCVCVYVCVCDGNTAEPSHNLQRGVI